ncbi:hypothetical protein GALMADRAFT_148768 [Galerina marginata CBS 339.88]|uniref:Uncharacterized protein n=1 Tax=Galerina marginata (strain CBS 339.88) TaxID=685588 RepID=A0A067SEY4_GALM3|nr:hypothetical protein GALMADRAFT_148768 [Galerina marginata CBS 339.88]
MSNTHANSPLAFASKLRRVQIYLLIHLLPPSCLMGTDGSSSETAICPTEFRKLSLVLSAFPWATPHIIQVPKPLTDFTTILPRHKHFFDALHRFECSLFRLGQNVINNTALAPLIGLDLKKYDLGASSTVVSVHPKGTLKVSSKSDYVKLCSILCAYRTFEILALDSEISVLQPPIRLLPPLSVPKFDHDSEKLIAIASHGKNEFFFFAASYL